MRRARGEVPSSTGSSTSLWTRQLAVGDPNGAGQTSSTAVAASTGGAPRGKAKATAKANSGKGGGSDIPPAAAGAKAKATAKSDDDGDRNEQQEQHHNHMASNASKHRKFERLILLNAKQTLATHQLVRALAAVIICTFLIPIQSDIIAFIKQALKTYGNLIHGQSGHKLGAADVWVFMGIGKCLMAKSEATPDLTD